MLPRSLKHLKCVPFPPLLQEKGGRGTPVVYRVLNSCRDKSAVKPQNKALSPSLAEKKKGSAIC